MGTLLGIVGTSINNHFKIKELKELISSSSNSELLNNLKLLTEKNEIFFNNLRDQIKALNLNENSDKNVELEKLLNKMNSRLFEIETDSSTNVSNEETNYSLNSKDSYVIIKQVDILSESLHKEYSNLKTMVFALGALSVVMPLLAKYFSW